MPDATTLQTRLMLQKYQQQLVAARRLAMTRAKLRMRAGLSPEDPDPALNRHEYVKKVARELYTSLIYTGSENPVVEDIRKELGEHIGQEVEFTYPPGKKLCIVGAGPDGKKPLSMARQLDSYNMLFDITRRKIDQSMCVKPVGSSRMQGAPGNGPENGDSNENQP